MDMAPSGLWPEPGWCSGFKSHPVHFSVKGTVAAILTRRLKVAFQTTHSRRGEDRCKGRHK